MFLPGITYLYRSLSDGERRLLHNAIADQLETLVKNQQHRYAMTLAYHFGEAGDLANPGQVLLTVYDPRKMRLEVPVPVRLIEKLSLNQTVDITLERPTRPFKGKVSEIVGEIDPSSRTQRVKIRIDNKKGDVLPGTFGRVWVRENPRKAVVIPAEAITMVGQLEMVKVVENDQVLRRMVKTGPSYGKRVEILSGLSAGETILVSPLKEG